MSFFLKIDQRETRNPETLVLPDGRKRITRFLEVPSRIALPQEMGLSPGNPDFEPNPPAGWTDLLLTYFKLTDEQPPNGKDSRPTMELTFEQISATGETQEGGPLERVLEDGRIGYELNYLQFSGSSFTPGTVGVSTAPNDSSAYLLSVEAPNDGTLRRIKRTYVRSGILATDTETKHNGSLVIQTITSAVTVPTTPTGFTLVGQPVQNPNGLPIYTYTYAKGSGFVSQDVQYRQSPDQGTNGIAITTIHWLTASSVSTNPITPPASSVLVGVTYEDEDGYRVWTGVYAAGAGTISSSTDTRNNGKLILYKLTTVNAVPTAPSSTIGGTVVLISANKTNGDQGVILYQYEWAEGEGQISQDIEYRQSADQGTNGVTITTIKYFTASSVTSNPISGPASSELIRVTYEDVDGYRIWTGVYANGQGVIFSSVETKHGGKLILYKTTSLNAAPTTPGATIGGTVVNISAVHHNGSRFESGVVIYEYEWAEGEGQISSETTYSQSINQGTAGITRTVIRYLTASSVSTNPISPPGSSVLVGVSYEDVDGYRIWTGSYATGTGTISSETETKEFGQLVVYRITAIGTAPSTPAATIGGTVVLIDAGQRTENGFVVFEYRWAEGKGVIDNETNIVQVGALVVYHILSLGVAPTTPSATLGGTVTLVEQKVRNSDGYQIYDYRWAEGKGQASLATRGMPDGAILYEVTTTSAAASTPPYPGSGTAYLVDLVQEAKEGYYLNRATWHLPPATLALSRTVKFYMPGQIEVQSSPAALVYVPPVEEMKIQVTETVSYSTTQDTTAPFTVEAWPSLSYSYIVASNGQTVTGQKGLVGYLSGATGASGSSSDFNGINCSSWSYTITSSTPSAPPSGSKVIENENTPYLTDIYGVVVFRIRKQTYSF